MHIKLALTRKVSVTPYWHHVNQSQRWPYNARRLAGYPLEMTHCKWVVRQRVQCPDLLLSRRTVYLSATAAVADNSTTDGLLQHRPCPLSQDGTAAVADNSTTDGLLQHRPCPLSQDGTATTSFLQASTSRTFQIVSDYILVSVNSQCPTQHHTTH